MAMTSSYSNLFGTTAKPKSQQGFPTAGLIDSGAGQMDTPKTTASSPTPGLPQMTTFAQMQKYGYARPASPQYAQSSLLQESTVPSPAAQRPAVLNQVQNVLGRSLPTNPSRYDTDLFNQIRDLQKANLEAEFGAQRSMLNEEMARRGLSSSSIAAGRYGDLAGQQARAMAGVDIGLLERAAETQAADREARDRMFIALSQMLATLKPEQVKRLMGG